MSRKTRKLIWSAPLVAVLAVAGALAIFVALSPESALAHVADMHGPPGPVSGLTAAVATDDPSTGPPEGRTALTITWQIPDVSAGTPASGYRIDYSADTRVWHNLEPSFSDMDAEAACAANATDTTRCYTHTGLDPATKRYYRVFAMNAHGDLSPVSVGPTYVFATTLNFGDPSEVPGLTASTTYEDKIVLNWHAPADDGGGTIVWYCIDVAGIDGNFTSVSAANSEPD